MHVILSLKLKTSSVILLFVVFGIKMSLYRSILIFRNLRPGFVLA